MSAVVCETYLGQGAGLKDTASVFAGKQTNRGTLRQLMQYTVAQQLIPTCSLVVLHSRLSISLVA